MYSKIVWPVVVVVCALLISASIFFGLQGDAGPGRFQLHLKPFRGSTMGAYLVDTRTGHVYYRSNMDTDREWKLRTSLPK